MMHLRVPRQGPDRGVAGLRYSIIVIMCVIYYECDEWVAHATLPRGVVMRS